MDNSLKAFLEPKSIAIVGISRTPNRPGYLIMRNLIEFGFAGDLYPVNLEGGEILGLKTYKSIYELPENIELAVSMVPADDSIEFLDACSEKGIKNVLLVSGGFSESGETGAKRQREVVRFARQKGIRLMGPNAVGPVNTSNNLILHFYPIDYLKKGGVAFVAQSGQFCCPVMEYAISTLHMGMSKSIDLGNCCDIDEAEVLEYLEADSETKVIAIYMESIRAGKRFLQTSKRVSQKKPIVVFKTGRTEDGLKTAASHTGAIAVNDLMFDVALKQAGIIRARDLDEFLDLAKIFDYRVVPKGNRVAVITYSGGIGAMVADACEDYGLKLAEFSRNTIEEIQPTLLPSARVKNPLDCFAVGVPPDINNIYRVPLGAFMVDENVDMTLFCFMANKWVWNVDFDQILKDIKKVRTKPVVAWVIGEDKLVRECTKTLEENGIPVFASPERAIRALGALWRYHFCKEE
ncbi:MAG: CoA-binding protein [Thermodesulfobacteriota bacterium]|nr:CoA-binding protein [Thermodesulfobacteriota bacterium]